MIQLDQRRAHPINDQFELILKSDSKELIELLKELQTAQQWEYATKISAVDVMVAIASIDKERQRTRSKW